jgi:drug/metabolite transporter (DMT)-like permease
VTSHPTSADNVRGIIALLVSQALFVTSDSCVKMAGAALPATQIMALRGLIAVTLSVSVLVMTVGRAQWRLALQPLVAVRAGLEAVSAALFIISLPHLTLAAITVLMQVTPLTITLLSALVLGEHVGWRRWSAILVGFIGVTLVAQPGSDSFSWYSLTTIGVALLISVRDLVTRRLDRNIPTAAVTVSTTSSVCLLGFSGMPLQEWHDVSLVTLALLAASACLVTTANAFIIRAFRGVDISVVSPFRYFGVIWGLVLSYAIWSDTPNMLAMAGMVLIVASGLFTMHRETQRFRQAA